jgi:hypothetical protein
MVRRRESLGVAADAQGKTAMFAASLAVVVVAGVAASIAFGIVCTTSGFVTLAATSADPETAVIVVPFLMGGGVGLYVFYRVMKAFPSGQP